MHETDIEQQRVIMYKCYGKRLFVETSDPTSLDERECKPLIFDETAKNELRKTLTLTLAVLLVFAPSYLADIGMRRLKLNVGVAGIIAFSLFLVGLFLLLKFTKD